MQIKQVRISPDMAEDMLKNNSSNRPISKRMVTRFVKEIQSDNWKMTGDTIKLSKQGRIIDGQHRLQAIVIAKVPVTTMVAYDVEDNCFEVIDTGKRRSQADVLSIDGHKNSMILSSALRMKYCLDNVKAPRLEERMRAINTGITNTNILNIAGVYPGMDEAVIAAQQFPYASTLLTKTIAVVCMYDFIRIDRGLAHLFFEKIETGADLSGKSPLLFLRNKLIEIRNTPGLHRVSPYFTLTAAFLGWNYLIEGNAPSKWVIQGKEVPLLIKPNKAA